MYYSTKSWFHLELFRGVNFTGREKKTCQSKMFCFVFSQLHLFCILGLVQTQLGIITMRFNIYVALAMIKPHKQGCLFSPLCHFFKIYNTLSKC